MLLRIAILLGTAILPLVATTIRIPADMNDIQSGVNQAVEGDTILVAPGEYYEHLLIHDKAIVLGSWYLITGDTSYIRKTIINGNNGNYVLNIANPGEGNLSIIGFTIRNGDDGITASKGEFELRHNIITACNDGIDYESGSGGRCYKNIFENNSDDGIDLDGAINIIIENNIIRNNDDDGIEIRLHKYSGPILSYNIIGNLIEGNDEDGIQLIDYPDISDRIFHIERNIIVNNKMAGLGCMSDGNTRENYEGANIPEPIFLVNNTIVNHRYGVTGGGKMIAINNIIIDSDMVAMKNVQENSIVSYCNFWENGTNFDNCNIDSTNMFYGDPTLDETFQIIDGSICINNGTAIFIWQEDTVLNISPSNYNGSAPDIGAFEFEDRDSEPEPLNKIPNNYVLDQNYPNPFNPITKIQFALPKSENVIIVVYDTLGQKIQTLLNKQCSAGYHEIDFNAQDVPSGIYIYQIQAGNFHDAKKMMLLK